MSEVTRILSSIDRGDAFAAGQLLPLVYAELRKLAAQKLAQEKPGQVSTGITFSPDGSRVAAFIGSLIQRPEVGLWDVLTGRLVLVLRGHSGDDFSAKDHGIAFLPGGDQILSIADWSPGPHLSLKSRSGTRRLAWESPDHVFQRRMRRSDWRRTRPYNSLGRHPEICEWNRFASK
jgi:WD40 repeat protein